MAITRKGPGNPVKVASKMTKTSTSKLKNFFTNVTANMKAEQAGKDQLKKYQESLRQKKLAEQKAQKDLQLKERGGNKGKMSVSKEVKVTGKTKPTYERGSMKQFVSSKKGKSTYYASGSQIPTDSLKFMQQMAATNPAAAKSFTKFMKSEQAKYPGARFDFKGVPNVVGDVVSSRPIVNGKIPKSTGKKGQFQYYVPTVTTLIPKKGKKK